jgi:chloride channel protein, CIC family
MERLVGIVRGWGISLQRVQSLKLVILPSLTGAVTGAATIAFVELLKFVQWLAIGSTGLPLHILPGLAWYHVLIVPALGGLVVGPLVRLLAPEAEGHGVPEVIEAVMLGGGRIRRRVAAVKSIASAVTIGTGGSVGREGPIVQIGAAVGSALGQVLRLPADQLKTLAACGAAGGIAAVFNAPIAGAFFALEVIAGNFAMPAFGPVVLSSVIATVISRAYFGNHPAFVVQPYQLESVAEIGLYLGLGVLCGMVAASFIWVMERFENLAPRVPIPKIWRPAAGGLVLGALILAVPNLYGVGYATMDGALSGKLSWTLLALLLPAKIVATSLTLSSGGSGGVFLPSLYIGSVAGGLYGSVVHALFPHITAGSGAYALVGMAGVLSAATHSPMTAMILLFEVTGDYAIILPVMIVTTLATLVGQAFKRDSLYTLKFSRRGIALHRREDMIMRSHTVREIMRPVSAVIDGRTPISETVQYFLDQEVTSVFVTSPSGNFVGVISIHDIKSPDIRELGPVVVAQDVAAPNVHVVAPENTLADCMDHFVQSENDELPVVEVEGRLVGVVSRRDVLRVYTTELLHHEYVGVAVSSTEGQGGPRIRLAHGMMLTRVPVPSWLARRSLREANLRATYNLTVVGVRDHGADDDRLPDPTEPLRPDDVLVVVGKTADIDRFRRATGTA